MSNYPTISLEKRLYLVVQFYDENDLVTFLTLLESHGHQMGSDFTFGGSAVAFHQIESLDALHESLCHYCVERLKTGRAWVIPQKTPGAVRVRLLEHHVQEMDERLRKAGVTPWTQWTQ